MNQYSIRIWNLADQFKLESLITEMKTLNQPPFRFLRTTKVKLGYHYFDVFDFEYIPNIKGIRIYFPLFPLHQHFDSSAEKHHNTLIIQDMNLIFFFIDSLNQTRESDQLKQLDSLASQYEKVPLVILVFYNLGEEHQANFSSLKESYTKINYNRIKIIDYLQYHETGFVGELFSSIQKFLT